MSSVLNAVAQQIGGYLQREHEQKMYDQQVANNIAQWQRQNQYDSPSAQMDRFQSAGLNPNLIYGQMGTGSTANNIGTPSVSDQSSNIGDALASLAPNIIQSRLADSTIDLQEAQAKLLRNSTPDDGDYQAKFKIDLENAQADLSRKKIELSTLRQFKELELEKLDADSQAAYQIVYSLYAKNRQYFYHYDLPVPVKPEATTSDTGETIITHASKDPTVDISHRANALFNAITEVETQHGALLREQAGLIKFDMEAWKMLDKALDDAGLGGAASILKALLRLLFAGKV